MARHTSVRYGLRIVRQEGALINNDVEPPAGAWVAWYDPDANQGLGGAEFTLDPARALAFRTPNAALRCWRQRSHVRPTRFDGKPNRPLTCYTVMCEALP